MMPIEDRVAATGHDHFDRAFRAMISAPDLRSVNAAGDREGLRRDIRRIASTLFCSAGIDPSIVDFAKHRTALHWGVTEHDVDVMVTARLMQKTASLIRDLHWLGAERARGVA